MVLSRSGAGEVVLVTEARDGTKWCRRDERGMERSTVTLSVSCRALPSTKVDVEVTLNFLTTEGRFQLKQGHTIVITHVLADQQTTYVW